MKIEEAIGHYKYGISHDIFQSPVTEYAQMAVEALEKQMPKNVIVHEQIKGGNTAKIYLECPACGFCQDERHVMSYCPMCGQRLK